MEIKYTISAAEYQRLKDHSAMLGRIAGVVSRYAHTPETTTYECVVALNERVRKLNAKVRNHKNAGADSSDERSSGGTPEMKHESKKGVVGVALARLVRGAWWLAWVPLFILAALYVGMHIPCALLILATRDDCAASRWLHDSTDWALDGIWKICPANAIG